MQIHELCALALSERALDLLLDDVQADAPDVDDLTSIAVRCEAHLAGLDPVWLATMLDEEDRAALVAAIAPRIEARGPRSEVAA